MKYTIFGILGLIWLIGCQSDSNSIIAGKFGDTFQVKNGQEAQLSGSSTQNDLIVIVESITDSRCPEGVSCIWAGNAQVNLSLSKEADSQEVDLCIGDCHSEGERYEGFTEQDTTSVTVASQSYEVILKAVVPYPTEEKPAGEKEAVLEINLK